MSFFFFYIILVKWKVYHQFYLFPLPFFLKKDYSVFTLKNCPLQCSFHYQHVQSIHNSVFQWRINGKIKRLHQMQNHHLFIHSNQNWMEGIYYSQWLQSKMVTTCFMFQFYLNNIMEVNSYQLSSACVCVTLIVFRVVISPTNY